MQSMWLITRNRVRIESLQTCENTVDQRDGNTDDDIDWQAILYEDIISRSTPGEILQQKLDRQKVEMLSYSTVKPTDDLIMLPYL